MEITIENYESQQNLILDSINSADFISFDLEFSGYSACKDDRDHEFDTYESRYQKLRSVVNKYIAFQVGLTTFKWDERNQKYLYRPFSFYVWPKSKIKDESMMFSSGSILFMVANHFDFNKLFDKGINYARYTDAKVLKQLCTQKVNKNMESLRTYAVLSKSHQEKLEELLQQIDDFVYNPNQKENLVLDIPSFALRKALNRKVTDKFVNTGLYADFNKLENHVTVRKSNTFNQYDFISGMNYEVVDSIKPFTDKFKEAQSGKSTAATVNISATPALGFCDEEMSHQSTNGIPEGVANENEEMKEAEKTTAYLTNKGKFVQDADEKKVQFQVEHLMQYEIGFSSIIECIAKSGKPLIGHNMKFDLAYIFHQFYRELPEKLADFTKQNRDFMTRVYDTKCLAKEVKAPKIGKTDLAYLYKKVTEDKKFSNNIQFEADKQAGQKFGIFETNSGQGQQHDASYDSFMTGVVFASISKYIEIGIIVDQPKQNSNSDQQEQNASNLEKTQKKRDKKAQEKEASKVNSNPENQRKIKHFSAVQNKQIYYPDIEKLENKIMFNIDVPQYWDVADANNLTEAEIEHEDRIQENVIYLQLKPNARKAVGGGGPSVFDIEGLFTMFGDINIVKDTELSCFIEFQDIDTDVLKALMAKAGTLGSCRTPAKALPAQMATSASKAATVGKLSLGKKSTSAKFCFDSLQPRSQGFNPVQKTLDESGINSGGKRQTIAEIVVDIVCSSLSSQNGKKSKGKGNVDNERQFSQIIQSICLYKDARQYEYKSQDDELQQISGIDLLKGSYSSK